MRKLLFLALCVSSFSAFAEPSTTDRFKEIYDEGVKFEAQNAIPRVRGLEKYRFVFVDGFLNEIAPNRFNDFHDVLDTMGHPKELRHLVEPSSVKGVDDNYTWLAREFESIGLQGDQKLVIVSHSKGAAESLAAALTASEELRSQIEQVFVVQGAMKGSPFADVLVDEGERPDERMPVMYRKMLLMFLSVEPATRLDWARRVLGLKLDKGLLSLTTKRATQFWEDLLGSRRSEAKDLNDRIFYVRSFDKAANTNNLIQLPAYYMETYYGANDGLVTLAGQTLEQIGTLLQTFRADHVTLLANRNQEDKARRMRRSFAYALTRFTLERANAAAKR